MFRRRVLAISILVGLAVVSLGACSSEESKLESEIINKEAFLLVKTNCELTQKVMLEKLGATGGSLENCIGTLFDNETREVCKKKGFEIMGTTCVNVKKRVKARLADYFAEELSK